MTAFAPRRTWIPLFGLIAAAALSGCPNIEVDADSPMTADGPRLVIFDAVLIAEEGAMGPPPPETRDKVREILKDTFATEVMFEDEAFSLAKRTTRCPDLRCYADVARRIGAEWMLYSKVFSFVTERCMFRTTLTSIETGESFSARFPGEAKEERDGGEIRYIIDDPSKLAQCGTSGFYDRVSRVAGTLYTEHREALR